MLPAAGGYTKPTNPAVLSHDYFPAEVLSETPTDKPVRWEGLPYIFTCGCCQQAEILISYTANLAGFTETLPKRNPELQSRRFVSHCQAEDNCTQHLAPTYFQTASRIHTDSIQRSAATVCDEECSALETQCCHCDPLPLPRASGPLFQLNARKGLRSLKWKLPLNPNHLKHGCRLMLLTIIDSERHSFSILLQKKKKKKK